MLPFVSATSARLAGFALLLPVLALLGCGAGQPSTLPEGPLGYTHAIASNSCAPWDGAATDIVLTPTARDSADTMIVAPPYLQLSIWRAASSLPGATLELDAGKNVGAAIHCPVAGECERAAAATVRFWLTAPEDTLQGTIDAAFPAAGRVTGGFRAAWRHRTMLCG